MAWGRQDSFPCDGVLLWERLLKDGSCTHPHPHTHTRAHMCMHACTHTHTHTCTLTHTCIHTHAHTCARVRTRPGTCSGTHTRACRALSMNGRVYEPKSLRRGDCCWLDDSPDCSHPDPNGISTCNLYTILTASVKSSKHVQAQMHRHTNTHAAAPSAGFCHSST